MCMFVQVKLLNKFPQPLLYKVPDSWDFSCVPGTLVQVSLRNRTTTALVIKELTQVPPNTTFNIKELLAREPFPNDPHYFKFINHLGHYYQVPSLHFIERIAHFVKHKKPKRITTQIPSARKQLSGTVTLTQDQQIIVDALTPHIITPRYTPALLHGVTGSGKTEVYKKLIESTIAAGKTVLFLLPEVTLALQFERILRRQLPERIAIYSFHSATSTKNKRILWQKIINGEPLLIIGVHLPILTPFANLGLIIVDEEHETGYQEKKHPKINTKEAALWRAQIANIPILLGSATPSVNSLYNVQVKKWLFFELKKRFTGALPTVEIVLLTDNHRRTNFWISKKLQDALAQRLAAKEQTILFLNRRGFSFFVQCSSCSFIFTCANCSVSLTLHANNTLHCHYCAFQLQQPTTCPSCSAHEDKFIKKGIGTQQLVNIIANIFPSARIGRADMDITTKKELWQETLSSFENGTLDILIGTQTVTKGFHFPRVTLVGIIWADLNLHFPIYNASETTLQQLIQVAGRAGREQQKSNVIVQTMAHYPVLNYLNEIHYPTFYAQELEQRTQALYPPYARLAEIEIKHHDQDILDKESLSLAHTLRGYIELHKHSVTLLGPAKPLVHKIKQIHVRKIYLKSMDIQEIIAVYKQLKKTAYKSKIFFTPNPLT